MAPRYVLAQRGDRARAPRARGVGRTALRVVLAALAIGSVAADERRQSRQLTVVNALDDAAVDVFYGGHLGRGVWDAGPPPSLDAGSVVCVAADVRPGFEFSLRVARAGDEFYVRRRAADEAPPTAGVRYAKPGDASRAWRHARDEAATLFLVGDEPFLPVWDEDMDAFSSLARGGAELFVAPL